MPNPDERQNMPAVGAWSNVTGDGTVARRPALLHGVVILANANGGRATLYAGQDASGGKIGTFKGWEDISVPIYFSPPLPCDAGIYVDDCSHIDQILVLWSPQ